MKKLLAVAAAVLCAASVALAGEEAAGGYRLELGLTPGWLDAEFKDGVEFEGDGLAFGLNLKIGRYGQGPSWSARASVVGGALYGFDVDGVDAEFDVQDVAGWRLGATVGWGFKLGERVGGGLEDEPEEPWILTPLLGVSYRDWDTEIDWDAGQVEQETGLLAVDLGLRIAGPLSLKTDMVAQVLVSRIVAGESEFDYNVPALDESGTEDVKGGWAVGLNVGWVTKLKEEDMILHVGLVYERLRYELDAEGSPEQDIKFFGLRVGAVLKF